MIRLDRLLSNRGYCSRRDVRNLIREGRVAVAGKPPRSADQDVDPALVTFDSEPLDPAEGIVIMLHKPAGYSCSHKELGNLVYDLLPSRFSQRKPALSTVGRLDKDTTGLLLLTDDGELLHNLTSPKKHVPKRYYVELAKPMAGNEKEIFASGDLVLPEEDSPLLPAELEIINPTTAYLVLHEGRYHQIKRMFEALGNSVLSLHRQRFGALELLDLAEGAWKFLSAEEITMASRAP